MSTLFPFRPNWRRPLLERLSWLTEVFQGRDGSETRTPLRAYPRRTFEYELLLQGQDATALDALLWGWQTQQYLLPIWTDRAALTETLFAGSIEIPVNTIGLDFVAGGQAVLWAGRDSYEVIAIDSLTDTTITLTAGTIGLWPTGTRLYPVRLARLPLEAQIARQTPGIVTAVLRFELDNVGNNLVAAPSAEYPSHPLSEWRAQGVSPVPVRNQRMATRMDYDLGAVTVDDHTGYPALLRSHQYLLRDRAAINSWRAWLHTLSGRAAAFWQPDWQLDLVQSSPIAADADQLRVRAIGHAAAYGEHRRDIAIRTRAGAMLYRRVLDVTVDGAEEVLTLDSPLGIDAVPGDFVMITWLSLSRLEADAVEIAWHTESVAQSTVEIRSVSQ